MKASLPVSLSLAFSMMAAVNAATAQEAVDPTKLSTRNGSATKVELAGRGEPVAVTVNSTRACFDQVKQAANRFIGRTIIGTCKNAAGAITAKFSCKSVVQESALEKAEQLRQQDDARRALPRHMRGQALREASKERKEAQRKGENRDAVCTHTP